MSCVYFLQADSGPIKIGFASNLKRRLSTLISSNDRKITMLAKVAGNRELEKSLHRQFEPTRIRGEWYAPSDGLIALIDRINNGTFEIASEHAAVESVASPLKSEIREICRDYIVYLTRHDGIEERSNEEMILSAATYAGVKSRIVKAILYREIIDVSAETFMLLHSAFLRKYVGSTATPERGLAEMRVILAQARALWIAPELERD